MKKTLKYNDDNSDKFWKIEVKGQSFTVTYGKNGTSGTSQTKTFSTVEECLRVAEKLLAEKVKKGYSETGDVTVVTKPKNAKGSNSAEVLQEYDEIIKSKNINLLLPFLKEKSKGNVEALKKHIKKSKNNNWGAWWGTREDQNQKNIITLSAIALFDKADINSWDEAFFLLNEIDEKTQVLVLDVLLWAKPNWLETFILDKVKRPDSVGFNYHTLRKHEDLGLLQFNPELYALTLGATNEWRTKMKARVIIAKILEDKKSYQRDIPELFNYETILHSSFFRDNDKQKHDEFQTWAVIYKSLLEEKKMERESFIENAILIQTKEWNNNLKSFFRKRIEEFNFTADELILYQENIFSFLHNPYPPITSYGIELIKKIYHHPKFKTKSFLEWLEPLMMRSDCKAAIKSVLPILKKINKSNPKLSATISSIIADVYLITDLALQERATKIITKVANVKDKVLKEKLSSYGTLMQGNIKSGLTPFLNEDALAVDDNALEEYVYAPKTELLLTEEVEIPKNWNDIVFQFSKFINSDEILDTEILLNVYISQRDLFPKDYSVQLEPYLKQLQRLYCNSVHKDFARDFLIVKISNIYSNSNFKMHYDYSQTHLNPIKFVVPLFKKVQQKIIKNSNLPLLSFPSHKPYWITPNVLIKRIIDYENANEEIDLVDLSIAISRMPRENVQTVIPLLDKIQEEEIKQLLSFCLGLTKKIGSGNTALWAVAARTYYPNDTFTEFKNTCLQEIPFVVTPFKPEFYFKEKWNKCYNYQTKEKEKTHLCYELRFDMPNYSNIPNHLLYSHIYNRRDDWDYFCIADTYYWHSITPQNSDALALILLQNRGVSGGAKTELKDFLNVINRAEFRFSDISLLLYACCFFQEKSDTRTASEVLIYLVEKKAINIDLFAEKLAYLSTEKYGTFLRLIEGLLTIKDVSTLHNNALLKLLNSFFANLDFKEKLPTNFKKIIEIYLTVLTKTNQKPSAEAIVFFEKWKDNASLKSLIKQILK